MGPLYFFSLFVACCPYLIYIYLTSRFFENESNEIFSHLSEIWPPNKMAGFFHPISCKIAPAMEKERTARKSEEEERWRIYEKAMVALLVFIMGTLEII